jgi:pSer/pThr/pTyr-binding forkhead associated (FHA) protein
LEVTLEIRGGPLAGKTFPLRGGQTITVGRANRSDIVIPQDTFLSGVHFALECNGNTCRVVDRKSANGTLHNRVRVTEAVVRDGDEITAGKTPFIVHIKPGAEEPLPVLSAPQPESVAPPRAASPYASPASAIVEPAPSPQPPTASIGGWRFGVVPKGWTVVEDYGLRRLGSSVPAAEIAVSAEQPLKGATLTEHVKSQLEILPLLVLDAQAKIVGPATIQGAEEAVAVAVQYKADDGRGFAQRQFYVRNGHSVNGLTLTGLLEEFPVLLPAFEAVLRGLSFDASGWQAG